MEMASYEKNNTNVTVDRYISQLYNLSQEDSNWIVTSSFMIFTMQTGFGMLESGCVSLKNEVNIMMKNVVDIVLGGLTYWIFGFGISFGLNEPNNPFIGTGGLFIDPSIDDEYMGSICAAFLFQLSFATTSTTIVSGAMAERCNFKAYCVFSFLNTIVYCVPAGWVWGDHGFLKNMGVVDIAGSGPVHLVGGVSGASGLWGVIAIGLFADNPYPLDTTSGRKGLFKGGGWYLLGIQSLSALCLTVWSFVTSLLLLWVIDKVIPIRMSVYEEVLGADLVEHRIRHSKIGVSRAMSALRPFTMEKELKNVHPVGINPGHDSFLAQHKSKKFKNFTNSKKQQPSKKLMTRNSQIRTIADSAISTKAKPHFAWMD